MTFAKTSICVNYKFAEQWHVFSSDDLPGLYVASRDAERAYKDVGAAIEKLLRLNEGIACRARPELSFQQFLEQSENDDEQGLVLSDKRFSLIREMATA
jgi:hypothetical protein